MIDESRSCFLNNLLNHFPHLLSIIKVNIKFMARKNVNMLKSLENISSLLQSQTETNINNTRVLVSPLTTEHDLNLKTAYFDLQQYYTKIARIAYDCSDFIDYEKRPSFEDFLNNFSDIDKRKILLEIYNTTYDSTLGKQKITCPCGKNKFEDEIKIGDLMVHGNSFAKFDKTIKTKNKETDEIEDILVNFKDYEFEHTIELNRNVVVPKTDIKLIMYIPPIAKTLEVLKLISREEVVDRINTTGSMFTAADQLTIFTKRMELHIYNLDQNGKEVKMIEIEDDPETVNFYIKKIILEKEVKKIVERYDAEFSKYDANLKKPYVCANKDKDGKICGREFDFGVDIEVILHNEFFRNI